MNELEEGRRMLLVIMKKIETQKMQYIHERLIVCQGLNILFTLADIKKTNKAVYNLQKELLHTKISALFLKK
jgi:hypothetical protein